MMGAVKVRFWGTRGSIASPGPGTARYGGNTSCVELRAADGTLIVLDCGTGARELGLHLVQTEPQPLRIHLFIGHTHWDHIQGFPFFVPAFLPGTELNIYAPLGFQRGLEEGMGGGKGETYVPGELPRGSRTGGQRAALPSRPSPTASRSGAPRAGCPDTLATSVTSTFSGTRTSS